MPLIWEEIWEWLGHLQWATLTTSGVSISCLCSDTRGSLCACPPWSLTPAPISGSPGGGCEERYPRSLVTLQTGKLRLGKRQALSQPLRVNGTLRTGRIHTLGHPCPGSPPGRGCIQRRQLQLGKCPGRTGAAWDRIRVSLRSDVSLAAQSWVWVCPLPVSRGLVFMDVPHGMGYGWPHPGSWTPLRVQQQLPGPQPMPKRLSSKSPTHWTTGELLWHFPVTHSPASACLATTPGGCGGWRVLASQMGRMDTPAHSWCEEAGRAPTQHPPTQTRRTVWPPPPDSSAQLAPE